ncbi:unnamed protein product [Calypogeia fissa]
MPRMGLLRGNNGAPIFGWRVTLLLVVLVIFRLSFAMGQLPVAFSYVDNPGYYLGTDSPDDNFQSQGSTLYSLSELQGTNITCVGDFSQSKATNGTGRCLYKNPVNLLDQGACLQKHFGTMFSFHIPPISNSTHSQQVSRGLAFIMTSNDTSTDSSGLQNSTTNGQAFPGDNLAVQIEIVQVSHVYRLYTTDITIGVNGVFGPVDRSIQAQTLTVWIDYDFGTQLLVIYIGDISQKPMEPIIEPIWMINLTETLSGDIFVGFQGVIANMNSGLEDFLHNSIFVWTFDTNGPAPDLPRTADGGLQGKGDSTLIRSFQVVMVLILLLFLAFIVLFIFRLKRRNARLQTELAKKYDINTSVLCNQGPKNFEYKTLSTATKGFSSSQLVGTGGFGSVYMGKLVLKKDGKPIEIAVKRISDTSNQGATEFLAEVKIIGQVQHRNLVRLLGWCHERDELLLVYDYMPNGSLYQHLHNSTPGEIVLTWSRRLKIVSGVATALAFLHDEWVQRVIHRDVKSSNIMLDHDFYARLGDFGLARTAEHDKELLCTEVAGTRGYLAPELGVTFRPTEKTDVYSFGAVVLEVATGKKPRLSSEDRESLKEIFLVDWVWNLYRDEALLDAADSTLHNAYDPREMVMFLKIGLLCCHPNPDERPSMRDVISIWKGSSPFPPLPRGRPVPVFPLNADGLGIACKWDETTVVVRNSHVQADEAGSGTFKSDTVSPSQGDSDSPLSEKAEERSGSSASNKLHYRPRTSTSLPF